MAEPVAPPPPKTADEGLAAMAAICRTMEGEKAPWLAKLVAEAVAPIAAELMHLRLENERLTAALHRRSEGMH